MQTASRSLHQKVNLLLWDTRGYTCLNEFSPQLAVIMRTLLGSPMDSSVSDQKNGLMKKQVVIGPQPDSLYPLEIWLGSSKQPKKYKAQNFSLWPRILNKQVSTHSLQFCTQEGNCLGEDTPVIPFNVCKEGAIRCPCNLGEPVYTTDPTQLLHREVQSDQFTSLTLYAGKGWSYKLSQLNSSPVGWSRYQYLPAGTFLGSCSELGFWAYSSANFERPFAAGTP